MPDLTLYAAYSSNRSHARGPIKGLFVASREALGLWPLGESSEAAPPLRSDTRLASCCAAKP
eukprot:6616504-Pyramimonas_sp.AAC.1